MSSEFDKIVDSCVKEGQSYLEVIQNPLWCVLIVEQLEPTLVQDTTKATAIFAMVRESNFKDLLVEAATSRSFERVREHIVRTVLNVPDRQIQSSRKRAPMGIEESFEWEYVGSAVDGLHQYLRTCEEKFNCTLAYQGKFIGIVQSSGTGKSRTVIELLKRVPGVYMNIRSAELMDAYPYRDKVPADIIGHVDVTKEEYTRRCIAFFTALFRQIRKDVGSVQTKSPFVDWSRAMCELGSVVRERFFAGLELEYKAALAVIPLDDPWELTGKFAMLKACADLVHVYRASSTRLRGREVVIAFDSVRALGRLGRFRPSDVLREVLGKLKDGRVSVWFLFISSGQGAADFSSLARDVEVCPVDEDENDSAYGSRFGQSNKRFPPYSQFGWDQFAPRLGEVTPDQVARFSHLVGFGRVLWKSVVPELTTADSVIIFACQKLCNAASFSGSKPAEVIAVLGQRFSLDIQFGLFEAPKFQRKAISHHLSICLDSTEDGTWETTLYPSEPILSCAAAELLHQGEDKLVCCLGTLEKAARTGLVKIDKNGQLVSRLLFLIAKDLCVRSPGPQKTFGDSETDWRNEEIRDCKPLSVVAYLELLFGEDALDLDLKAMFKDWYINFSHWICMDESIGELGSGAETWLKRLWYRTGAVQSSPGRASTDKIVPMYKLLNDEPGHPSYILITDSKDPTSVETSIPDIGQPYIVIFADLRETNKPRMVQLVKDTPTPHLRIYAPGISTKKYPFLGEGWPSAGRSLRALLELSTEEDPEDVVSLLKRQVKFGATSNSDHMNWEEGR